ncbi:MAG TPA: DnaJ C-terminal domain-containing protein [Actinomycetota bacterium]|nr:DnaJ C-terminal domain-containing protein [Actinomycetota bacterium]
MAQRDWIEKDYYKVLGVPKSADKDDIRKAYRKLAQKHHPDANKSDGQAESRFKEISEAYSVLSNEKKRAEYDEMRRLIEAGGHRFYGFGPQGGGGNVRVTVGDVEDLFGGEGSLFEDLLGGFGFRAGRQRGADLETEIELDFDQAMAGTSITLESGTKVRIPPGIANNARIRVAGKGRAGAGGAGDLFVRVRVRPHHLYQWDDDGRLVLVLPLTYAEATLGTQVEVPTPAGPVKVKIPPGTPNGKLLRLKGKGAPKRDGGRGDLFVHAEIEVPKKLSKRERELLEEFARAHTASPRQHLEAELSKGRAGARAAS